MAKISFFDTLSLTPYLDHLLKSDLHQNRHKISQDTPVQSNCVYFMLLYNLWPVQGPKLAKMGENTSIWWSGPLGFGVKVISYNSCIVQCCPHIWGEGGGGQWAKSHFEEGGGGQWAKPHFGGWGGGGQRVKLHRGWWWSASKTSSQLNRILLGDGGYK